MKTKEYRIFEVDEYGNKWFEMSYSGHPEMQRINAERYVETALLKDPARKFEIIEV